MVSILPLLKSASTVATQKNFSSVQVAAMPGIAVRAALQRSGKRTTKIGAGLRNILAR